MDGSYKMTALRAALLAVVLNGAVCLNAAAQGDDFGMWYEVAAQKKLGKKWSVDVEGEFRTRNDAKTADRWSIGAEGSYKVTKWLKASAGYTLLYDNNAGKLTYNDDGAYNNWRPSYWGVRHRINVALTGSLDLGRWTLSLRERWQYTYRPEKTTERYDFDNYCWEDKTVKSKGRNVLRSKLKVDYNIRKCKIDPHADVELFNAWDVQKVRYSVGADWKITKAHTVGVAYYYQHAADDDDDGDTDSHIIGISYKFKF